MTFPSRPAIYVTDTELERLSDLAHAVLAREPAAGMLIDELARARVTEIDEVPPDVVRMQDRVSFVYDGTAYDDFTLVYPNEANIETRHISVLTQVGAMLIGLQVGNEMCWRGPDQRVHQITVLAVSRP